jgi:hypothetical protein
MNIEDRLQQIIKDLLILGYESYWQEDFEIKVKNRLKRNRSFKNKKKASEVFKIKKNEIYLKALEVTAKTLVRRIEVFPKRISLTFKQIIDENFVPTGVWELPVSCNS